VGIPKSGGRVSAEVLQATSVKAKAMAVAKHFGRDRRQVMDDGASSGDLGLG